MFVPALTGLGAPHWDPDARGAICGLTRGTHRGAHRARDARRHRLPDRRAAAKRWRTTRAVALKRLRVDGGASANDLLMQFQADLLGVEIDRPSCVETTALGAAYLAGLAVGVFGDTSAVAKVHRIDRTFRPAMSAGERAQHLEKWRVAVRRARSHA